MHILGFSSLVSSDIHKTAKLVVGDLAFEPSMWVNSLPFQEHSGFEKVCVCLLLQDLVISCFRGEGGDMGGHVLRETTTQGLCGRG
jgi:hypothetical protein